MSETPRTDRTLLHILHSIRELCHSKTPEELVALARELEEENAAMTDTPFTCFRCRDGNTPLYCLNCAEDISNSRVSDLERENQQLRQALSELISAEEASIDKFEAEEIDRIEAAIAKAKAALEDEQ